MYCLRASNCKMGCRFFDRLLIHDKVMVNNIGQCKVCLCLFNFFPFIFWFDVIVGIVGYIIRVYEYICAARNVRDDRVIIYLNESVSAFERRNISGDRSGYCIYVYRCII